MPNVTLNGDNLLVTLAVILIILEGLSVVSKGVEAWKKLTGRDERAKELVVIKDRLTQLEIWSRGADHRIQQEAARFDENQKDTLESLKALHRIIKHLQSGNDHDKLSDTDDRLFEYLVKRGVSPKSLE